MYISSCFAPPLCNRSLRVKTSGPMTHAGRYEGVTARAVTMPQRARRIPSALSCSFSLTSLDVQRNGSYCNPRPSHQAIFSSSSCLYPCLVLSLDFDDEQESIRDTGIHPSSAPTPAWTTSSTTSATRLLCVLGRGRCCSSSAAWSSERVRRTMECLAASSAGSLRNHYRCRRSSC